MKTSTAALSELYGFCHKAFNVSAFFSPMKEASQVLFRAWGLTGLGRLNF